MRANEPGIDLLLFDEPVRLFDLNQTLPHRIKYISHTDFFPGRTCSKPDIRYTRKDIKESLG